VRPELGKRGREGPTPEDTGTTGTKRRPKSISLSTSYHINTFDYDSFIRSEFRKFESGKGEHLKKIERIFEACGGCDKCARCCREVPCELDTNDVVRLCRHLEVGVDEFDERFVDWREGCRYLKIPCPFLDESDCSVHKARPYLCRTFPFNPLPPVGYKLNLYEYCGIARRIAGELGRIFPRRGNGFPKELASELGSRVIEQAEEELLSERGLKTKKSEVDALEPATFR